MKRTLFVFGALLILIGCSRKEKENAKQETAVLPNDLPAMPITLLDGKTMDAKSLEGKTILILFQPDCDHCQHEAEEIEANLAAFRDHTLYFVSSAAMPDIKNFANQYKLSGIPNVLFGWTATENVLNNFGPIQAPSIYIYSGQGKLVKQFNGQVGVGELLKYL